MWCISMHLYNVQTSAIAQNVERTAFRLCSAMLVSSVALPPPVHAAGLLCYPDYSNLNCEYFCSAAL
jgi:hypothetical protein